MRTSSTAPPSTRLCTTSWSAARTCRRTCSTNSTSWSRRGCATRSWRRTANWIRNSSKRPWPPAEEVATRDGALPADYAEAEAAIRGLRLRALTPQTLASMLRNGETTKFLVAMAELADVDFHTARRILEKKQLDALRSSARRPTSTGPCS